MVRALKGILIGDSPVTLPMAHSLLTQCHNCPEKLPVLSWVCAVWVAWRHNQNANHTRWIYHFLYSFCICPLSTHLQSQAQSVVGSLSAHYLVITHNLLQQTCYKDRQLGVFLPKLTRDWPFFNHSLKKIGYMALLQWEWSIFVTSLDPGAQSIRCCYQSYYRL